MQFKENLIIFKTLDFEAPVVILILEIVAAFVVPTEWVSALAGMTTINKTKDEFHENG